MSRVASTVTFFLLVTVTSRAAIADTNFLRVEGSKLVLGDEEVYLSGANLPWVNYGNDFGNAQPNGVACALQDYLADIRASGGNSIRVWLFVEGDSIPLWDEGTGFVLGTDSAGTLIDEVDRFVSFAASQDVLVTLCLWNGALMRNEKVVEMVRDADRTQSFIDNALTPLVEALAGLNGLGAWEIMNEPEGSVLVAYDDEPCFDTSNLEGTGAGWAGTGLPMRDILRFTNQLAAAIKAADPKALVTTGAWSEWTITSQVDGARDYYSDECLVKAGGLSDGTIDFVQVHSYAWEGSYRSESPFSVPRTYYEDVTKPILIGEFASTKCQQQKTTGSGCSVEDHYAWGLGQGYSGTWDWSMIGGDGNDDGALCAAGMAAVAGEAKVRAVQLGADPDALDDTCSCSDVPPDDQYSCAEQAAWGKCEEDWMVGFCCKSCFGCSPDAVGCGSQ